VGRAGVDVVSIFLAAEGVRQLIRRLRQARATGAAALAAARDMRPSGAALRLAGGGTLAGGLTAAEVAAITESVVVTVRRTLQGVLQAAGLGGPLIVRMSTGGDGGGTTPDRCDPTEIGPGNRPPPPPDAPPADGWWYSPHDGGWWMPPPDVDAYPIRPVWGPPGG
jgi:hypothetical protein